MHATLHQQTSAATPAVAPVVTSWHQTDSTSMTVDTIHRALAETNRGGLRAVRCRFERGVVTVQGTVESYYLKQLAQETVRHIPAVKAIRNELKVR